MAQQFGTQHAFNAGMNYNTGGGFLAADPTNQGGGSQGASQGDGQRKPTSSKALLPCTIHQIANLATKSDDDDGFQLGPIALPQVTIVGRITERTMGKGPANFTVDDGTGSISVQLWIDRTENDAMDTDAAPAALEEYRIGMYVRAVGSPRDFKGTRYIFAFRLIPVTDFNEITFHNLDVIASHLTLRKRAAGTAAVGTGAPHAFGQPVQGFQPAAPQGFGSGFTAAPIQQQAAPDANDLTARVLHVVMRDNTDVGLSLSDIAAQLPGVSVQQVQSVINSLSDDGQVYSTIDEEHFKYSVQ